MEIKNCEIIELALSATDLKKNFIFSPILKGKKIKSIFVYDAAQVTGTPRGAAVISAADAKKVTFTLVDLETGKESLKLPATALNPAYNNGQMKALNMSAIDLDKSYITLSAVVSACSVPVFFVYE
jgi:hypothetical protein